MSWQQTLFSKSARQKKWIDDSEMLEMRVALEQGLTKLGLPELAKRMRVSEKTVREWNKRISRPSRVNFNNLKKIAEGFGSENG